MALLLFLELVFFIAARNSVDLLRKLEGFTSVAPQMPILEYAYWKFAAALLLLVWLKARGAKLSDYGFRNLGPIWLFLLIAFAAVAVSIVVPGIVDQMLEAYFGKTPVLSRFAALKDDLPLFLFILPFVWLFAAFGEEFFYRGFVLENLRRILGGGAFATVIAIVAQGAMFGAAHSYQGPAGMISIAIGGTLLGFLYWAGGRRLWPMILAHGIVDTLGLYAIYSGLMAT